MIEKLMNIFGYQKVPKVSWEVPHKHLPKLRKLHAKTIHQPSEFNKQNYLKFIRRIHPLPYAGIHWVLFADGSFEIREGLRADWGKGYRWVKA